MAYDSYLRVTRGDRFTSSTSPSSATVSGYSGTLRSGRTVSVTAAPSRHPSSVAPSSDAFVSRSRLSSRAVEPHSSDEEDSGIDSVRAHRFSMGYDSDDNEAELNNHVQRLTAAIQLNDSDREKRALAKIKSIDPSFGTQLEQSLVRAKKQAVLDAVQTRKESSQPSAPSYRQSAAPVLTARVNRGVFVDPKTLFESLTPIEVNFGVVEVHGQQRLVALKAVDPSRAYIMMRNVEYTLYNGSPYEALLTLAKTQSRIPGFDTTIIDTVLNHPQNGVVDPAQFVNFVLQPGANHVPRIFSLSTSCIQSVFRAAKQCGIKIDPRLQDPVTGITLFEKCAGEGYEELTQMMLDNDPTVIAEVNAQGSTCLFRAASSKWKKKEAALLVQAMQQQGIDFSHSNLWIAHAFYGSTEFEDAVFNELPPELKKQIYTIANEHGHEALVLRLDALGAGEKPLPIRGPNLFSLNANFVTARKSLEQCLLKWTQRGVLSTAGKYYFDLQKFKKKESDIGRILGRDFIERTAQSLGSHSVKVPRKFAVVKEGLSSVSISMDGGVLGQKIESDNFEVYAEFIKPSGRKHLTREEMAGLLKVLVATRYSDITLGFNPNFIIAADGVYIIDTDYQIFRAHPAFEQMGRLEEMMAERDHQWLQQQIRQHQETYVKMNKDSERIKGDLSYHHRFKFETANLIK